MNTGQQIKQIRLEKGLSLGQLARTTGLTKGFLSQLESGRSQPSLASLSRIAAALRVDTSALLANVTAYDQSPVALMPALPMLLSADNAHASTADLRILRAAADGTHILVDLAPTVELSSTMEQASSSVLCICTHGSVVVEQSAGHVRLTAGSVATWDGGTPYAVRLAQGHAASVVLFVPQALSLPELATKDTPVVDVQSRTTVGSAKPSDVEGPLRLVAMRAQRLAERKQG